MKYILELTRWRCGSSALANVQDELKVSIGFKSLESEEAVLFFLQQAKKLGAGGTAMLNGLGYSCCLGQFAQQVGVPNEKLRHCSYPGEVAAGLGYEYDTTFIGKTGNVFSNNRLASDCTNANDSGYYNVLHKINDLRALLNGAGHELEVQFKGKAISV